MRDSWLNLWSNTILQSKAILSKYLAVILGMRFITLLIARWCNIVKQCLRFFMFSAFAIIFLTPQKILGVERIERTDPPLNTHLIRTESIDEMMEIRRDLFAISHCCFVAPDRVTQERCVLRLNNILRAEITNIRDYQQHPTEVIGEIENDISALYLKSVIPIDDGTSRTFYIGCGRFLMFLVPSGAMTIIWTVLGHVEYVLPTLAFPLFTWVCLERNFLKQQYQNAIEVINRHVSLTMMHYEREHNRPHPRWNEFMGVDEVIPEPIIQNNHQIP